jgi:hypothetical protein
LERALVAPAVSEVQEVSQPEALEQAVSLPPVAVGALRRAWEALPEPLQPAVFA